MGGTRVWSRLAPVVVATLLVASAATPALAQGRGLGHAQNPQRRAVLEKQFRQRGEEIVRRQLNLSDDQMRQLRQVNGHFDGQRRALVQQEREARVQLRDEIARGSKADQGRVSQLMAQVRDLQQQRFVLQQQELKQLSGFLTPVQQAQYEGLVTRLRERARELRAGEDTGSGSP